MDTLIYQKNKLMQRMIMKTLFDVLLFDSISILAVSQRLSDTTLP